MIKKYIFGVYELDIKVNQVNKKEMSFTVQNPFVSYKQEKTFVDKTEERLVRKVDRQVKKWRKEFFQE